jgi:hypothetical protein
LKVPKVDNKTMDGNKTSSSNATASADKKPASGNETKSTAPA